jgi:hypothetical protein
LRRHYLFYGTSARQGADATLLLQVSKEALANFVLKNRCASSALRPPAAVQGHTCLGSFSIGEKSADKKAVIDASKHRSKGDSFVWKYKIIVRNGVCLVIARWVYSKEDSPNKGIFFLWDICRQLELPDYPIIGALRGRRPF